MVPPLADELVLAAEFEVVLLLLLLSSLLPQAARPAVAATQASAARALRGVDVMGAAPPRGAGVCSVRLGDLREAGGCVGVAAPHQGQLPRHLLRAHHRADPCQRPV